MTACGISPCAAEDGHDGTCAEASGWDEVIAHGVQQKRTKGYRLPENTRSVTRSSRYGNPFRAIGGSVIGPTWDEVRALALLPALLRIEPTALYTSHSSHDAAVEHAVALFDTYMSVTKRDMPDAFERWIDPLRGVSLACFCALGSPCHRNILLRYANA